MAIFFRSDILKPVSVHSPAEEKIGASLPDITEAVRLTLWLHSKDLFFVFECFSDLFFGCVLHWGLLP